MLKFSKNSAELVYKTGQLASENFQFGPSVRHSQELLTLIWCSNCYNPARRSLVLAFRQWISKIKAEWRWVGRNKEKLSEVTNHKIIQPHLAWTYLWQQGQVRTKLGYWRQLRLFNYLSEEGKCKSIFYYNIRTPGCSMRGVSVSYRH